MKIFASNANNIINLISKFKNNTINKNDLNKNILSTIIFNYYYFKKDSKKIAKEKEAQNKMFQNFLNQEEKQIKTERIYLSKERNKIRREEIIQKYNNDRKLLLDNYKEKADFNAVIEPTFDCYIPIKQFPIPLEFYNNKIITNLFDQEEDNEIKKEEQNENKIFEEENKKNIIKGINNFTIDIPIHLCEDSDNFFDNDFLNNIEKDDEESNKYFIELLKTDDNILFYEDEKMDLHRQMKSNKDNNQIIINTKKILSVNDDFELDKNLSKDEIVENHYKEFSYYLPLTSYTKYIKKMNYVYLHLMLMSYFELEYKINNGLDLYKGTIIINHIKKIILECGICSFPLYDKIIKNVINLKDNNNFENYIKYFNPIFKGDKEFQSYKYKYLLYLCKNKCSEIMTQLEFDMFLNLANGKSIYDKETYSDLIKRFKVLYKKQYPKENQKEYNYNHVNTIIEFIIDLNYENLSDEQ